MKAALGTFLLVVPDSISDDELGTKVSALLTESGKSESVISEAVTQIVKDYYKQHSGDYEGTRKELYKVYRNSQFGTRSTRYLVSFAIPYEDYIPHRVWNMVKDDMREKGLCTDQDLCLLVPDGVTLVKEQLLREGISLQVFTEVEVSEDYGVGYEYLPCIDV